MPSAISFGIGSTAAVDPSHSTVYVDAAWQGLTDGTKSFFPGDLHAHTIGMDAFARVQDGIDHTASGGDVEIAPGTYLEQLFIRSSVNVDGAGEYDTIIKAPSLLVADPATRQTAVIDIGNAARVTITALTVSGPGVSYADLTYGVFVGGGADLNISDAQVIHIRGTPFNGDQTGVGLRVGANFAKQVGTATITDVMIEDYQKGGIVVDGAIGGKGSYATIMDSTIAGAGATPRIAQNGIQVSRGAAAKIIRDSISNNYYTGADIGTGILFYQATYADSVVRDNTFSGNQYNFVDSTTDLTLTSSYNANTGDTTFTAAVTLATAPNPAPPDPLPGTVQFAIDGVPAGAPQPLNSQNQAQLVVPGIPAGLHIVLASYSGSDLLEASPSFAAIVFAPPTPPCDVDPLIMQMQTLLAKQEATVEKQLDDFFFNNGPLPDPTKLDTYKSLEKVYDQYFQAEISKPLPAGVRQQVEQLIQDLGDDSYAVRQAAQEKLIAIGPAAYRQVEAATKSEDLEVRTRANQIIKAYQAQINAQIIAGMKMCDSNAFDSAQLFAYSWFNNHAGAYPFPPAYIGVFGVPGP